MFIFGTGCALHIVKQSIKTSLQANGVVCLIAHSFQMVRRLLFREQQKNPKTKNNISVSKKRANCYCGQNLNLRFSCVFFGTAKLDLPTNQDKYARLLS